MAIGKKDMKYEGGDKDFTFRSMLETDPSDWDKLSNYSDFKDNYVEFNNDTNTLTLKNINVIGDWKAYYFNANGYRCINLNDNIERIIMEDTVSLPGNCIPYSAFNWTDLKYIVLPEGIKAIGDTVDTYDGNVIDSTNVYFGAFERCTSLTEIKIPKSVTSIGASAFYGCTSLTSIEIPKSVTSIGDYIFNSCTSLTSITTTGNNMKAFIENGIIANNSGLSPSGNRLTKYNLSPADENGNPPSLIS